MDNDISVTDHAPGFASAARFMAANVSAVCCDVHGLPAHVSVIEALGRNAGWVAAASAMADESGTGGPDLIYLPERDFDEDAFLDDSQRLVDEKRSGVIVVSEGLHKAGGVPVAPPPFTTGRSTYFGDVSAHLAQLIISKLGCRVRSEKPGLMQRAPIAWQSEVDRDEAIAWSRGGLRGAGWGFWDHGGHRAPLDKPLPGSLRAHPDRARDARGAPHAAGVYQRCWQRRNRCLSQLAQAPFGSASSALHELSPSVDYFNSCRFKSI